MAKRTLQQKIANPKWRSSVPTNQLPPKYRAARLAAERAKALNRNPLYNPTAVLAGAELDKAARDITEAEVAPKIAALQREGRNVGTQGTAAIGQTGSLYRELAQRELENVATQRALRVRAGRETGAIAQQNVDTVDSRGKDAQGAVAADGLAPGATERLAAERQALTARAAAQGQGWKQAAEFMGGNYEGLQTAMAGARQTRGSEMLERLATRMVNQQSEIGSKVADTEATRGDLYSANLQKLRQQGFENQAVLSVNTLKAADLEQEAADARAQRRLGYERARQTRDTAAANRTAADERARLGREATDERARLQREAQAEAREQRAREKAEGKPPKDTAYGAKVKSTVVGGRSRFRELSRRPGYNEARVRRIMTEKDGLPLEVYKAIYDLERKSSLHPANARALEDLGVVIPKGWRRRNAPVNSPSARPSGGT